MDILSFVFSSFWVFIGSLLLIELPLKFLLNAIKLFVRQRNISKHGWPPEHLDADGDFKTDPEPPNKE